jgi:hypothetical protein
MKSASRNRECSEGGLDSSCLDNSEISGKTRFTKLYGQSRVYGWQGAVEFIYAPAFFLCALEILHCSLMSFGSPPRRESSKIAALAGLRIFLT